MKNIVGNRYGRWTVIRKTNSKTNCGTYKYECRCDCGTIKEVSGDALRNGSSSSCGCLKIDKLKETSKKQYIQNTSLCSLTQKLSSNNTSGRKGVYWCETVKKWRAIIWFKKKKYHLGYFKDFAEAVQARENAEEKYYKPFLKKYGRIEE